MPDGDELVVGGGGVGGGVLGTAVWFDCHHVTAGGGWEIENRSLIWTLQILAIAIFSSFLFISIA